MHGIASGNTSPPATLVNEREFSFLRRTTDFFCLSRCHADFYLVEEFFYAACELQQLDWAQFFLQMIRLKFPQSVKVMRMLAIFYEARGELDKAQNILFDIVDGNLEDKQSLKRLVALYRDMGWSQEAIQLLNKYTECN